MVDMKKPVQVIINGKPAFDKKVIADKDFLLNSFKSNYDRASLWVTSIKLKVE